MSKQVLKESLDDIFRFLQSPLFLDNDKTIFIGFTGLFYRLPENQLFSVIKKLEWFADKKDLLLQCCAKERLFDALSLVAGWLEQFPERAIPQEVLSFYDDWTMPWEQGMICLAATGIWPIVEEKTLAIWQCIRDDQDKKKAFCEHLYKRFTLNNKDFKPKWEYWFRDFIDHIVEDLNIEVLGNLLTTSIRECVLGYAQYESKTAAHCIFLIVNGKEFNAEEKRQAGWYLLDHQLYAFFSLAELRTYRGVLHKIVAQRKGHGFSGTFDNWLEDLCLKGMDLLKKVGSDEDDLFFDLDAIRKKALLASREVDDIEENQARAVALLNAFTAVFKKLASEKSDEVYKAYGYTINVHSSCSAFERYLPEILVLSSANQPEGTPIGGYAYYLYKIIQVIKDASTHIPEREVFSPQQELLLGLYSLFPVNVRDWTYEAKNLHEVLARFYYSLPLRYRMQRFKSVDDFNESIAFQVLQTLYQRALTSRVVMKGLVRHVTDCNHSYNSAIVKNMTYRQLGIWHIREPSETRIPFTQNLRQTAIEILGSITIRELCAEVKRSCQELKQDPLYSERERIPEIVNEQQAFNFVMQTGFLTR
jgi:hypothetical protein